MAAVPSERENPDVVISIAHDEPAVDVTA